MSRAEALRTANDVQTPNDLAAWWMPFTPNRAFKQRAAPDRARQGHALLHARRPSRSSTARPACGAATPATTAIRSSRRSSTQAAELDYRARRSSSAHPKAFELASRIAALAPGDLDHVFFCNSGSEAVDTALKIALAYHNVRGEAARTRLIGRERGYHGVGFGGISVGGIVANRKLFGTLLAGVDHLPHTYNREQQAFTKGEPEWGAHLADELDRLVALHDASTIAAVIVEPMAGSTGVLPPPKGYLQAPARDLRQARHPADLRRGHHRLRPARLRLRGRALRRHARHDHLRQGRDLRHGADGRRDRAQGHLRRLHERARARDRAVPRLHLLGPSARLRGRPRDARRLSRREPVRARAKTLEPKWADAAMSLQGPAERASTSARVGLAAGDRPRLAPRRARQARL